MDFEAETLAREFYETFLNLYPDPIFVPWYKLAPAGRESYIKTFRKMLDEGRVARPGSRRTGW